MERQQTNPTRSACVRSTCMLLAKKATSIVTPMLSHAKPASSSPDLHNIQSLLAEHLQSTL